MGCLGLLLEITVAILVLLLLPFIGKILAGLAPLIVIAMIVIVIFKLFFA